MEYWHDEFLRKVRKVPEKEATKLWQLKHEKWVTVGKHKRVEHHPLFELKELQRV